MERGLYITFFKEGEPPESQLPPVGPLEHVVLRDRLLLADRKSVHQGENLGTASRLLEAELELQRAMGNEPGAARHPAMRIMSNEGVYLRFASFGEATEPNPVPEFGPFKVVVIGPRGVMVDGELLATRTGSKRKLWDLTARAGSDLAGVVRPDIAFRSAWTSYRAGIRPLTQTLSTSGARSRPDPRPIPTPPVEAPVVARPAAASTATAAQIAPQQERDRRAVPEPGSVKHPRPAAPVPAQPSRRPAATDASALLSRIGADVRSAPQRQVIDTRSRARDWAGAVWRLRFAIIGVLVLMLAVFSVPYVREAIAPGSGVSVSTVGIGKTVRGARWEYTVTNVRRTATAGAARANGVYVVVQVAATGRGQAAAQLSPSDFSLLADNGTQYAALPTTNAVYQSPDNPSSPFAWPTSFPIGRAVAVPVIFDVTTSVLNAHLLIVEVPGTRIRLE